MKTNALVKAAVEQKDNVQALPILIAEWNMNRYKDITVDNTPAEDTNGYDVEMFPIESIVQSPRPGKGINKARVNQGTSAQAYDSNSPYQRGPRFYTASVDDDYKYWTSPVKSDSSGNLTQTAPYVLYPGGAPVNKIVIQTENTWATMKNYDVSIKIGNDEASSTWQSIGTQANASALFNQATGRMELYYAGNATPADPTGDWWNTRVDNADGSPKFLTVYGVRLTVTALQGGTMNDGAITKYLYQGSDVSGEYHWVLTDGKNAYFDLIELSARLEANLSGYLISTSDSFELSDVSNLYPLGQTTQNQSSVTLSNIYEVAGESQIGAFSKYTPANNVVPWTQYLESNVKMNLQYQYYNDDMSLLGSPVQQFVMYVDSWSGQSDEQVQVTLSDHMKFFNDVKPKAALIEGATTGGIVARLCDSIGFNNYYIHADNSVQTEHTIPVFYTDGEKTLQEVISDLAQATQAAIYFDGYGMLHVKTRNFAFNQMGISGGGTSADVTAVLTDELNAAYPGLLPNIISLDVDTNFDPNKFTINYQTTQWTPDNNGQPTMQSVWAPDTDTVVLRSTPLLHPMKGEEGGFWIDAKQAAAWPYNGMVNIDGELIGFDAKQYVYFTGSTGATKHTVWIKSDDEKTARDNETLPEHRYKNYLTGAMHITERGMWNSDEHDHPIDISGWYSKGVWNGQQKLHIGGVKHLVSSSRMALVGRGGIKDQGDLLYAVHGSSSDTAFKYTGTKFKFVKSAANTTQVAGMVLFHNNANNGYYIEITPTAKLSAKDLQTRSEVTVFTHTGAIGGSSTILGKARAAIIEGVDYEIDAYLAVGGDGNHTLIVWLNGKQMLSTHITSNKNTPGGAVALYVRGRSEAQFEYFYGLQRDEPVPGEDMSFLSKIDRAYVGEQWEREWVYKWKTRTRRIKKKVTKEKYRWNQYFYDDFGPFVHEIRKFDAKFDPKPVLHSRPYITNDWGCICLEYTPNPFGATFYLANTSRSNAVVHGDDTLSYAGSSSSINQVLNVFGRVLVIDDAENVVAQNDSQIRARGIIDSELSSDWIQSKAMAQDIADWLNDNWSYGNESFSLEIFGNPLIELGDFVHIHNAQRQIYIDGWVTSVNNSFDQGLKTTLTVRRKVA